MNPKCPNCGSTKVAIVNERSKHGVIWLLIFGVFYLCWWGVKAFFALMILVSWDWWFALIQKSRRKGYVWVSKKIIKNTKRTFHCENCSYNFHA